MTIIISCEECKSVLLVIDEKSIDKPMLSKIGAMVVSGRILERFKPGDTSYKKRKFSGEVDCMICGSTTNSTALFGPDDQEEKGPNIGMGPAIDSDEVTAAREKNRRKKK